MELDAIAAVVIGGTLLTGGRGLVVGSLLGVLVLGTIQTFISFDGTLSSWWTKITIGVLLLGFVWCSASSPGARHDEDRTSLARDSRWPYAGDGRRGAAGRASPTRPSRG